jgi:hypothetical protein
MKPLKSLLDYILFGNIFISICAGMLAIHTGLFSGLNNSPLLLTFIVASTMVSYNLHAYYNTSKVTGSIRIEWLFNHRKALLIFFLIACIVSIITACMLTELLFFIIPLGVLTLLYSLPRFTPGSIPLLNGIQRFKILYLALVWTVVTAILPVFQQNSYFLSSEHLLFFLCRYLFILQVCLMFDYKDKFHMLPGQRQSILKNISDKAVDKIFFVIGTAVLISSGILQIGHPDWAKFTSIYLPEILLFILYQKSKIARSDYWFNILVDGTMALPALILLVA